jgi:Na+/proline symporter
MPKIERRASVAMQGITALLIVAAVTSSAHAQVLTAEAPASFDVAGRSVILAAHGVGAQIYECKP